MPPPQRCRADDTKEAHTSSQEALPEYHVKARNTSSSSENKIHDEQIARDYGFRGALVPGVTVYAYLTHPLVEAFGAAWLERGTANVRFVKPIHDGEEVRLAGVVTSRDARVITATVTATTAVGGECATLAATLLAGSPVPVNLAQYPVMPLPADRPIVTREHLAGLAALGTPINPYDSERRMEYSCWSRTIWAAVGRSPDGTLRRTGSWSALRQPLKSAAYGVSRILLDRA